MTQANRKHIVAFTFRPTIYAVSNSSVFKTRRNDVATWRLATRGSLLDLRTGYGQNGDKPKRLQVQSKRINLLSSCRICVQPTVDCIGVTRTVVVWVRRRFDCRRFDHRPLGQLARSIMDLIRSSYIRSDFIAIIINSLFAISIQLFRNCFEPVLFQFHFNCADSSINRARKAAVGRHGVPCERISFD